MKLNLRDKLELALESNSLSRDGIAAVTKFLYYDIGFPRVRNDFSWEFMVQKGEYRGNIVTRLSKYYAERNYILAPSNKTTLGNIINRSRVNPEIFHFRFTKRLNWRPGDFGDHGSCFWGRRNEARTILEENGAYAAKFYDSEDNGIARCWLVKDRPAEDCVIIFNGYGPSSWGTPLQTMANVLSQYFGYPNKQISLYNWIEGDQDLLWINGFSGYLIGPEEAIGTTKKIDFEFSYSGYQARCSRCRYGIQEDDSIYTVNTKTKGELTVCRNCYNNLLARCSVCGNEELRDDMLEVGGSMICSHHEDEYTMLDAEQGRVFNHHTVYVDGENTYISSYNALDRCFLCPRTNKLYFIESGVFIDQERVYRGALNEEEREWFDPTLV